MPVINSVSLRRALRGILGPPMISLFERIVARRSWASTQKLGRDLGRLGFRLDRRHRRLAIANVRYAFGPDLPAERVEAIACGCFEHLAMLFLEALRMPDMSREELAGVVRINGIEHLAAALAAGHGAVTFSGHCGNWEVGAVRLIYEGLPLLPLSRASSSKRLARAITRVRERLGFPVIPVEEGPRSILRALKNNQIVPIMADRFARGSGLTVPFFGHDTHVWHTPALMARRAGCPVIPCHAMRQLDGTYVIEIDPPLDLPDSGDRDHDVWVTTCQTMAALEAKLRRYPEQYTWPYLLWRPESTSPPPYPSDPPCGNRGGRPGAG